MKELLELHKTEFKNKFVLVEEFLKLYMTQTNRSRHYVSQIHILVLGIKNMKYASKFADWVVRAQTPVFRKPEGKVWAGLGKRLLRKLNLKNLPEYFS